MFQADEGLIQPEMVAPAHSAAPAEVSQLYHAVDFCISVGPMFNFVSGKICFFYLVYGVLVHNVISPGTLTVDIRRKIVTIVHICGLWSTLVDCGPLW